jgi:hypothetical protein
MENCSHDLQTNSQFAKVFPSNWSKMFTPIHAKPSDKIIWSKILVPWSLEKAILIAFLLYRNGFFEFVPKIQSSTFAA